MRTITDILDVALQTGANDNIYITKAAHTGGHRNPELVVGGQELQSTH